jgi:hypothetical protein
MHLPTYIVLMFFAASYGLARLISLWSTNQILFFGSGIFVVVITVVGGVFQALGSDSLEWKWMLFYTLPLGLLAFGQLARLSEMSNEVLKMASIPSIPSLVPGESKDYTSAALNHFISMAFPLLAWVIAWVVNLLRKSV